MKEFVVPAPPKGLDPLAVRAAVAIPQRWLVPGLRLGDVRSSQRPDTWVELDAEVLHLAGVELIVERRWIAEPHWAEITAFMVQGYVHQKTHLRVVLRGNRRRLGRAS